MRRPVRSRLHVVASGRERREGVASGGIRGGGVDPVPGRIVQLHPAFDSQPGGGVRDSAREAARAGGKNDERRGGGPSRLTLGVTPAQAVVQVPEAGERRLPAPDGRRLALNVERSPGEGPFEIPPGAPELAEGVGQLVAKPLVPRVRRLSPPDLTLEGEQLEPQVDSLLSGIASNARDLRWKEWSARRGGWRRGHGRGGRGRGDTLARRVVRARHQRGQRQEGDAQTCADRHGAA